MGGDGDWLHQTARQLLLAAAPPMPIPSPCPSQVSARLPAILSSISTGQRQIFIVDISVPTYTVHNNLSTSVAALFICAGDYYTVSAPAVILRNPEPCGIKTRSGTARSWMYVHTWAAAPPTAPNLPNTETRAGFPCATTVYDVRQIPAKQRRTHSYIFCKTSSTRHRPQVRALSRVSASSCSRLPLHPSSARALNQPSGPSPNPSPGPLPETSSHSTIIPALTCKFRSIESRDSRSRHCFLCQIAGISRLDSPWIRLYQTSRMGKPAGESRIPHVLKCRIRAPLPASPLDQPRGPVKSTQHTSRRNLATELSPCRRPAARRQITSCCILTYHDPMSWASKS